MKVDLSDICIFTAYLTVAQQGFYLHIKGEVIPSTKVRDHTYVHV